MECKKDENQKNCKCTYNSCPRRGLCCECIRHHRQKRELPGCFFPKDIEKTFDRSFETFAQQVNNKKI